MANIMLDALRGMIMGAAGDALFPKRETPAPVEDRSVQMPPAQPQGAVTQARPDTANRNPMVPIDQTPVATDPMNQGINQDMAGFAQQQPNFKQVVAQRAQQLMQEADPEKTKDQDPAELQNAAVATAVAEGSNTLADDPNQQEIQSTLKKAFGNEEMWLTLAMGFNGMRLRPDATLGAALADRLKTIQTTKKARSNAPAIAAQLKQMGYDNMAQYVLANPQHAEKIYEKALATQLKAPTQFEQLKELAKTPEGRAQIKEWKELGVVGGQTINVGGSAGEKLAVADVQPIYQAAFNAPTQIEKIDETLNILESGGANTGMFSNLKQARDRFLAELGGSDAAQRASDTQLLNAFLGSEVFAMISKLGLGSRGMDTPAEREFLREVMTGKVDLTPQALIALANRRRDAEIGAIKAYEREKDSPAMKSYASQRSVIDYTSKDFERKKPEAPKVKKRFRYDTKGNRI